MEFSPRAAELTTLLESRMTNFYTNFQVEPASFRHSFPQLPQLLVCSGSFRTPDRCNRSTKPNYSFTPLIIPHSPSSPPWFSDHPSIEYGMGKFTRHLGILVGVALHFTFSLSLR